MLLPEIRLLVYDPWPKLGLLKLNTLYLLNPILTQTPHANATLTIRATLQTLTIGATVRTLTIGATVPHPSWSEQFT
jgi:hypothetical protein